MFKLKIDPNGTMLSWCLQVSLLSSGLMAAIFVIFGNGSFPTRPNNNTFKLKIDTNFLVFSFGCKCLS